MQAKPIQDRWEQGEQYERYVGRWSRKVATAFLAWLACPPGLRWLDLGCGTGALCGQVAAQCTPALAVGVEPSAGFLRSAFKNLAGRAVFTQGTATAIPTTNACVDVLVSGLMLNFVPDTRAALREMARVTRPGGTVGAYVWDYAGKMELMRLFWDAAMAVDAHAASLDEGNRFPICQPDALAQHFSEAGFTGVEVTAIDIPTPFASFDDYWQPFLGGQGSAPSYYQALDADTQVRLQEDLRQRVPTQADGSIALVARAWAVRGTVG